VLSAARLLALALAATCVLLYRGMVERGRLLLRIEEMEFGRSNSSQDRREGAHAGVEAVSVGEETPPLRSVPHESRTVVRSVRARGEQGDRSEGPRMLFITPVIPDVTGGGLAMRAGMVLQLLASRYRVWLLVASVYSDPTEPVPELYDDLCEEWAVMSVTSAQRQNVSCPWEPMLEVATGEDMVFSDVEFDVIHVFRLYTLPFARLFLHGTGGRRPERHLDIDDIESRAHERIAHRYRLLRDLSRAEMHEQMARHYKAFEDQVLKDFDRIYVCSQRDREELLSRGSSEVCVLPNAVTLPVAPVQQQAEPFRFLFVGTVSYFPNQDAVIFFCTKVLPRLRKIAPRPVSLTVVGAGVPRQAWWVLVPEVILAGTVTDVEPYYRSADAVVVPILAGGGTRIKALEAFACRRPVITTSIGVEGLDVSDEVEVLIADTAKAFAEQCVRLMTEPELGERLTSNAYAALTRSYTIDAVARTFDALAPRRSEE
jgi:glycosyltransferase involved in cell wall biosynthesis